VTTWEAILLLGLVVLNGLLAMARAALINVRRSRLKQLIEEGVGTARTAERMAEDASRLLATTQLGMMLTSFFASAVVAAVSAPALANLLDPWLEAASYPVAFVLVVLVAALVMLIMGELVPETIALQHSERLALMLAPPLAAVSLVAMPVIRLTVWLSNVLARVLGAKQPGDLPFVTEEEIKTLVDAGEEGGFIQEEEKAMIYSIFELGETLTREVMVPRIDVVAIEVETPMLEALEVIMEAGHSRIPVYQETIDNITGFLYAKDLLPYLRDGRTDVPLRSILREAYFVPETKKAGDLLPDLQTRRVHIAIVVDEYGGTAGLVTIEDLLEEIVGEIQDEYDTEEPFFEFVTDDEFVFDARVDLDDLNRLMSVSLPTDDADTLGGFIYTELGKVPVVGDHVAYDDLTLTVESVAGRRIRKVRVERMPALSVEQQSDEATTAAGVEVNGDGRRRWRS
jgi:putative hemolysin